MFLIFRLQNTQSIGCAHGLSHFWPRRRQVWLRGWAGKCACCSANL